MKGTPETPACGFSRAVIQILGLQGVDPNRFAAFNVLEDPELRSGIKEEPRAKPLAGDSRGAERPASASARGACLK